MLDKNQIIKCCFCKKEIKWNESHDPRPIVTTRGDRCCLECNNTIVIPTRIEIWFSGKYVEVKGEKDEK